VAGWAAPEAERAPLRAHLVELLEASALERAAAGLSLGTLDRAEAMDPVLGVLEELAYHPSVPNAAHFRWCLGDLRVFALQVADAVGPHAAAAVTSGLLRRIRELVRQKKGKREASTCANLLLGLHFRYRSKPTDTDGWSNYQHSLARALSGDDAPEARWDERGMPLDLAERRKVLRMT